jgi:hypothetical protein
VLVESHAAATRRTCSFRGLELGAGWTVDGMFSLFSFSSDSASNVIFEPTFAIERTLGSFGDIFVEYVGDYDHKRPSQVVDNGASWLFTKTQEVNYHVGVGLNRSSVDYYFGIGYSFRFDGLWG